MINKPNPIATRAFFNEGDDTILALNLEAKARKNNGEDIINASIGTLFDEHSSFLTSPLVDKELNEALTKETRGYPLVSGGNEFKEGILKWLLLDKYQEFKENFYTSVIATPGGTGAVALALRNYTEIGQKVLIPSLGWSNYESLIHQVEAIPTYYNLFNEDNKFDISSFKTSCIDVLKHNNRLFVIINDPCHNPTGYTLSKDELTEIVNFLNELGKNSPVILCMDIAYFDFCNLERSRLFFNLLNNLNNLFLPLICFSASKTFSIYGLRLGALIGISQNQEAIIDFEESSLSVARAIWSCTNSHAIKAITNILNDDEKRKSLLLELTKERKMLQERGDLFVKMAKENNIITYPYYAGFFVTAIKDNAKKECEKLKEKGIYALPLKNKYIRIALSCISKKEVREIFSRIK